MIAATTVLTQPYSVPAFGSTVIDVDHLVDSQYAAVVVEIDGGGGLVEQRATGPVGTSTAESVSACANSPASHWYLATGATADKNNEDLVLSNPYDEAAIVDVTLHTSAGTRTPDRYQNFTIPRQSVRVISLEDAAGPDEVNLGVSVIATRGNFVLGRSQTYASDTQSGYVMSLASPMLQTQWWFAYGEKGDDVAESYSLYNPGDHDVDVDLLPLGFTPGTDFTGVYTVPVPAGQSVAFDPDTIPGVPEGTALHGGVDTRRHADRRRARHHAQHRRGQHHVAVAGRHAAAGRRLRGRHVVRRVSEPRSRPTARSRCSTSTRATRRPW